jgi:hypothetical protein
MPYIKFMVLPGGSIPRFQMVLPIANMINEIQTSRKPLIVPNELKPESFFRRDATEGLNQSKTARSQCLKSRHQGRT